MNLMKFYLGVIETTKDRKNETREFGPKSETFKLSGSKRFLVTSKNAVGDNKGPRSSNTTFTGEVLESKGRPVADPDEIPNPDELSGGVWTGEAIDYTAKAKEDFAKQMKYMREHGGTMEDLVRDYNNRKVDQHAMHDPKNAEETKEKMKEFFSKSREIIKSPQILKDSKENKEVSESMKEKRKPSKQSAGSMKLGLNSSTGSETGSESETWTKVGANAGSLSGTDFQNEEPFSDDDQDENEWGYFPDNEYYDKPQGLGLWADTGTGVGVSVGANAGSESSPDDTGSEFSSPGFGFQNGFGMGMSAGSQSGSETMTETSVGINTETNSQSESKTGSGSNTNPGSKSKSKYKWKMGPSTNTGSIEKIARNKDENQNKNGVANVLIGGVDKIMNNKLGNQLTAKLDPTVDMKKVKEQARFIANPQLGIQANSDVSTKVHASASTQSGSGTSTGSTKPKTKPKSPSRIRMEKSMARLKAQMKKNQDELEESTKRNPLHRWKLFGLTPLQGRLEAIAERTRNIPLGPTKETASNHGNKENNNGKIDPNKTEASVEIEYKGKNTQGVDISAGVNISSGEVKKQPKKIKTKNGEKVDGGIRNWKAKYKWIESYPYNIPSIAEINKKLNSIPFALYKSEMRKLKQNGKSK